MGRITKMQVAVAIVTMVMVKVGRETNSRLFRTDVSANTKVT